jgi:hypothetical protein
MAEKLDTTTATMIQNLEARTGKTLAQWVLVARKLGAAKHGDIVQHLKAEHSMGHGYANLIAHSLRGNVGSDAPAADDLISSQYAGDKAALLPIYNKLIAAVGRFGADVEVAPKKTYVALRRAKQFALLQPSTKTRLDVGIQLKGVPIGERLESSGSFNAMVSHRVRVEFVEEIDAELIGWLKLAYDAAG